MAKVIAIEGADASGKETQARLLVEALENNGYLVAHAEVPFNDHVTYRVIYWMLDNGLAKSHPNVFQLIQTVNKLVYQFFKLPFAYVLNDYIIIDRWKLSTHVYGHASGANKRLISFLLKTLFTPDMTLVFLGASYHRDASTQDTYEKDKGLQSDVVKLYYRSLVEDPDNNTLVANDAPIKVVHERVMKKVLNEQNV